MNPLTLPRFQLKPLSYGVLIAIGCSVSNSVHSAGCPSPSLNDVVSVSCDDYTYDGASFSTAGSITVDPYVNISRVGSTVQGSMRLLSATLNTFSNYGSILFGLDPNFDVLRIEGNSSINSFTNAESGLISGKFPSVTLYGTSVVTNFINNGRIESESDAIKLDSGTSIRSLLNTGTITGTTGYGAGVYVTSGALINSFTNSGIVNGEDVAIKIDSTGEITTIVNSGSISGGRGINNSGSINEIRNSGTISGSSIGIDNAGHIGAITNVGTISGSINNSGVIETLNNSQGSSGALDFSGVLPTNYNIIIVSPNSYGRLAVSAPVGTISNFGIYGSPFLTSRKYSGVLTTNTTVTNIQSQYDNMRLALTANGDVYDLNFIGASSMGTQLALANTASVLQNTFTLQNSVLANSFTYDCALFDVNNICVSAGGRNTAVSAANGLNSTSGLLIGAYRPHPNYRVGAYIDQNLSVNNAGSIVTLGNNTPLIGLFGVWSQKMDGTGTEVKISAAYGQKNAMVTRRIYGLSEAGSGSSQLNSQGAQVTAKYGFGIADQVVVSPYVGMRYAQNNMGSYAETASPSVIDPLTFSALNTNATTALAGVGASYKFIPQAMVFASAGVETDTNTANGTYSATGVTGLTPINFNANPVKTRPTATVGAYYDLVKNQRLGVTGIYRQEPYQAVSTTTVMATYTIGL